MRIATIIDGNEKYGLPQAIANLVAAHDPRRVHSIAFFMSRGEDAHALTSAFPESHHLDAEPLFPLRRDSGPRFDPVFLTRRLLMIRRTISHLRRWCTDNPVDAFHVHHPGHAWVAWRATRRLPVRHVLHMHGPYSLTGLRARRFIAFARKHLDGILAISQFVADTLPAGLRDRVRVVYNGVPLARMRASATPGAFRRQHGLSPDQPLVGIFGAVMPRKGHRYFVEAAARIAPHLPDARFAFVGAPVGVYAHNGFSEELDSLIRQAGLSHRFIRTGFVPDAARLMVDFDVTVMPTVPVHDQVGEGFGLVMIESMAHGRPVIATDCGAPREVITHGVDGLLVPPGDADALGAAIRTLIQDPAQRARLGEAAARTVSQRFDAPIIAGRVADAYEEFLSGRDAPGRLGATAA